jgi:hypothetical protein
VNAVSLPQVEIKPDPIYEHAIRQGVALVDRRFADYCELREAAAAQERMAELEDLLRIRLQESIAMDMQRSVCRFRAYGFARYCREMASKISVTVEKAGQIVDNVLANCPERDALYIVVAIETLNRARVVPRKNVHDGFVKIQREYNATSWEEIQKFSGFQQLIQLIPEPTRRERDSPGDGLLMFSHFFRRCREVVEYFGAGDELAKFVKFVAFNSDYEALLELYLFVAKVFTANPELRGKVDRDGNWATFFGVMAATLKGDPKLWAKVVPELGPEMR